MQYKPQTQFLPNFGKSEGIFIKERCFDLNDYAQSNEIDAFIESFPDCINNGTDDEIFGVLKQLYQISLQSDIKNNPLSESSVVIDILISLVILETNRDKLCLLFSIISNIVGLIKPGLSFKIQNFDLLDSAINAVHSMGVRNSESAIFFLYKLAMSSEENRNIVLSRIDLNDVLDSIHDGDDSVKSIMLQLLLSFCRYPISVECGSSIILFLAKNVEEFGSNLLTYVLSIINYISWYMDENDIIIDSNIMPLIERRVTALNTRGVKYFLSILSNLLNSYMENISITPVYLCSFIVYESKSICKHSCELIVKIIEYEPDHLKFFIKCGLLNSISQCLTEGKLPCKIYVTHLVQQLVGYGRTEFLMQCINAKIVEAVFYLIDSDDLETCKIVINAIYHIFNEVSDPGALNFASQTLQSCGAEDHLCRIIETYTSDDTHQLKEQIEGLMYLIQKGKEFSDCEFNPPSSDEEEQELSNEDSLKAIEMKEEEAKARYYW